MPQPKIHFFYEECKEIPANFAKELIADLGQAKVEEADVVICIGGDGLLLQALRAAKGTPVYGLTPPASNSRGFWLEHGINNAQELQDALAKAKAVALNPLEAEITFANGNKTVRHAFNCVAVERAAGQAAIMNLTVSVGGVPLPEKRIMGDGFIFSTALGSTGLNRSYGGPAVDVGNDVIIQTGKGIYEPRGLPSVVARGDGSSFAIAFTSATQKRPVRIDYDGLSVDADADGSGITHLTVRRAANATATLLVTTPPAVRAFSVMMG